MQRGETVLVAEIGADAAFQELPNYGEKGFGGGFLGLVLVLFFFNRKSHRLPGTTEHPAGINPGAGTLVGTSDSPTFKVPPRRCQRHGYLQAPGVERDPKRRVP